MKQTMVETSRTCNACLETKEISAFHKDASAIGGFAAKCRACYKLKRPCVVFRTRNNKLSSGEAKASRKKSCHKYEKTKSGFLMRAYRNILSRVSGVQNLRAHLYLGLPIMPKSDFYRMSLSDQQFHSLFAEWEKSGYDHKITPSVDRIDPEQGYTPENIRWITHSQNSANARRSR